jgi:ABC-type phosphate transport system substrate-binding protein
MKSMKTLLFACLGLAGSVVAADLAQAVDLVLNGTGSSAGRQYAQLIPTDLQLCDNTTTPTLFRSHESPPNRTEWHCTLAGGNRVYRYAATGSAEGYTKQPNGATATAAFLDINACGATSQQTIGGRTVNAVTCGSSQTPAPSVNLLVHFGAADVKPTSLNVVANGETMSPPAAGHLTANPIVAVPFAIVVGGGVRAGGGVNPLLNLTQAEVRQILAGEVTNWTILGHDTNSGDKTIVVCQRTVISGTLATLMQTVMQSPGWFGAINPIASATNIFNPSSSNVKACVENNPNSIGYIDDDTVPNLLNNAHQVALDGFLPSNPALADGVDGTGKTRDVRCGKYIYWADWNIVTRTAGIEAAPVNAAAGSNALLALFQARAIATNPLKQFWADQNNTFVFKNEDKGPHNWFTPNGNGRNAATECSNGGSIQ